CPEGPGWRRHVSTVRRLATIAPIRSDGGVHPSLRLGRHDSDASHHVSAGPTARHAMNTARHAMNKVKVLFLAANPHATQPLQLDEEIRQITAKVRAAEYRDSLELASRWAVRPDDLLQALLEVKPDIVHFSGHGSSAAELIRLDDRRDLKPVGQE